MEPKLSPNTGATLQVSVPDAAERRASINDALQLQAQAQSPAQTEEVDNVSEETRATLAADSLSIRRWLVCFCVVNFDLNVGQMLEWSYPSHVLDDEDASNVCNLSFPDSNVSQIGDSVYCFTVRLASSRAYLHGVSFFRQQHDASNARGFFQKSVVLLSALPLVELFESIVSIVGPLYFEHGLSLLEAACRNISDWPSPRHLAPSLELPLLGHVLYADISAAVLDHDGALRFGSYAHVNVFREFRSALGNLWCLWETVLTGQPLLVAGSCQVQCSRAVLGLISLISPVPFR